MHYSNITNSRSFNNRMGFESISGNLKHIEHQDQNYDYFITYGPDQARKKTVLNLDGNTMKTKYYIGGYEKETDDADNTWEIHYIPGGDGLLAVYISENGAGTLYYVQKDHLGSPYCLTNSSGNIVTWNGQQQIYSFDPWGRRRNPTNWTFTDVPTSYILDRGFTGHEHLDAFGLVNMNGRMYDPLLGRMLSPDNYVQAPNSSQSFNRYSYCLNNPLVYVDPDGENPLIVAAIIGSALGAYNGGVIANEGEYNPIKWDDSKTWGYVAGGAIVSGISGYMGGMIATSGMPLSNTFGIASSSLVNSIGMNIVSGGRTPVSVNLGVASYNFSSGDWGHLGKEGNKWYQDLGYTFGALANVQDLTAGFHGTSVIVKSRKKLFGHSETSGTYNGEDITISVGPDEDLIPNKDNSLAWEWEYVKRQLKGDIVCGENYSYIRGNDSQFKTPIYNVNGKWLLSMTKRLNSNMNLLNSGPLNYGILYGCVNYNARALFFAGVLNVNALLPITSPVLLNAELAIRQAGFWAAPYLID